MNTIIGESSMSDILTISKEISFRNAYIRACNNHIMINYIPLREEISNMKQSHRVHLFINDMNFLNIAALLTDFIFDAYNATGNKVIIHIPKNRIQLKKIVSDICNLYTEKDRKMYMILPFNKPMDFLYSSYRCGSFYYPGSSKHAILEFNDASSKWIIHFAENIKEGRNNYVTK